MAGKLSRERQRIADALASLRQDTTDISPRTTEATKATKRKVLTP